MPEYSGWERPPSRKQPTPVQRMGSITRVIASKLSMCRSTMGDNAGSHAPGDGCWAEGSYLDSREVTDDRRGS